MSTQYVSCGLNPSTFKMKGVVQVREMSESDVLMFSNWIMYGPAECQQECSLNEDIKIFIAPWNYCSHSVISEYL